MLFNSCVAVCVYMYEWLCMCVTVCARAFVSVCACVCDIVMTQFYALNNKLTSHAYLSFWR